MKNGALIAMSGGVDSSVAALLCIEKGLDCIGGMMKLSQNNSCCTSDDAEDARVVAQKLGINFYEFDFTETFNKQVISKFVKAYRNGKTPNPCIECNKYLKFGELLEKADEFGKEFIVTGHYARIELGKDGRYLLKKGADFTKDQSYVLYTLTQEKLKRVLFPLGDLPKSKVRKIALENNLLNAKKKDSQDICFVQSGNYADFIEEYTNEKFKKGLFRDIYGKPLGEHNGIINYTIGQRKGLGISASAPLYVCALRPSDNSVIIGASENLYTKILTAKDINLIAVDKINSPFKIRAKIRYKQEEQPAVAEQIAEDMLKVEFDNPQRAVTKGQSVVLYDGDVVVGGGKII